MYNHQLDTFVQTADAGSFSKAAKTLYISATAVMKQINLLESSLGVKLFNRSTRGLTLTESGRSYYRDARFMIQYAKEARQRAQNAAHSVPGTIRIGMSVLTPGSFLVPLWPEIQTRLPDIRFELVSFENSQENAQRILSNLGTDIDVVAGIFDESLLALRRCAGVQLSEFPVCCAVSVDHPLAAKERLTVGDLAGQRLMMIRRGWSRHIDELRDDIENNHPEIELVSFDCYDLGVFNECERSGAVLVTFPMWDNVHPLIRTLQMDWKYSCPFGLLHSTEPSERVQRLIDVARNLRSENLSHGSTGL